MRWLGLMVLAAALVGCGSKGESATEDAGKARVNKPAKPDPNMRGSVLMGDKPLPVKPFVGKDPRMDLFVGCRKARAEAEKAGTDEVPLCYDPTRRTEVKHLRIEYNAKQSGGAAMRRLRPKHGAAHLMVERSGSVYQILDLAYAPRRDGKLRPDEIRIVSGSTKGHDALRESLLQHFPGLTVEVVEVELAPSKQPKKTEAAPEKTP